LEKLILSKAHEGKVTIKKNAETIVEYK